MLIFLTGMMGSGKTTLGRQLAAQLGYTFIDLDAYIEKEENKSIARIFEEEGQEQFRQLERQALEAIVQQYAAAVVATGGGTPCFFDNSSLMNKYGQTVFLDVPLPEILKRLAAADLSLRPLLANKTEQELSAFLTGTLAARRPFYKQARHTLQGPVFTAQALAELLNYN